MTYIRKRNRLTIRCGEDRIEVTATKVGAHWALHRDGAKWAVSSTTTGLSYWRTWDRQQAERCWSILEEHYPGPTGPEDADAWAKDHGADLRNGIIARCESRAWSIRNRAKLKPALKERRLGMRLGKEWATMLGPEVPTVLRSLETIGEENILHVEAHANGEQFDLHGPFASGFYRQLARTYPLPPAPPARS